MKLFSILPTLHLGSFSRFIKPGAKRIACTSNNDNFVATAFTNLDGTVAVVILNMADNNQKVQIWVDGKALKLDSPAESVITVVL